VEERPAPARPRGRIARNTAIFSLATGLSRVAGLVREIVASSYFATSGAFSAFTIAFQVPNLVRSLFADAALSAAFVPVFSELLERGKRREAARLAATLAVLIVAALGAITALFIVFAPTIMPLFTGSKFDPQLDDLLVGLSRVLFPIVVLLGLNGLVVGILNVHDHFSIPALAPARPTSPGTKATPSAAQGLAPYHRSPPPRRAAMCASISSTSTRPDA